ncbi:MAG: hypothetical protein IJZ82_12190 [Lachnospiraceae bacterium]|nr:hypothetical protein [Lachnospiraceae bacterium]
MKYINAAEILPETLLQEIQRYVDGELLYIPKKGSKKQWGAVSGSQFFYTQRNQEITTLFKGGTSISELAQQYGLAESTIKKIIYE